MGWAPAVGGAGAGSGSSSRRAEGIATCLCKSCSLLCFVMVSEGAKHVSGYENGERHRGKTAASIYKW